MLPVVWLDSAIADLTDIITYIVRENPSAARPLKARGSSAVAIGAGAYAPPHDSTGPVHIHHGSTPRGV